MPQIFISTYKFNEKNTKLIDAITRYNICVQITQVNGVPMSESDHAFCSDLKTLTSSDESPIKDYVIVCRSQDAKSTIGIFPYPDQVLDDEMFAKLRQNMSAAEIEHSDKIAKALTMIFTMRFRTTANEEQQKIETLNASQALLILEKLVNSVSISGVMHFSSLQRVLFQHEGTNFIIKYGDKPYITTMKPRAFDLEAGFIEPDEPSEVTTELQKQFIIWKENGYEGPFIPVNKSGFDVKVDKPINDINSIAEIQQRILADYRGKYNMEDFDELMQAANRGYAELKMHTSTHDFLEQTLLYAAGQLPLANELRSCIHLGFDEHSSNIILPYKALSLYMGMPDSDFYTRRELTEGRVENKELPAYIQLNRLVHETMDNLNKISDRFAVYDREHHYYRKSNLQYNLVLNRKLAAKAYLKNPVFVAQFLLAHENEISDKAFIATASKSLHTEVMTFRDMRKGISNEVLDNMLAHLNSLADKYEISSANTANVSTHGLFALSADVKSEEPQLAIETRNQLA